MAFMGVIGGSPQVSFYSLWRPIQMSVRKALFRNIVSTVL